MERVQAYFLQLFQRAKEKLPFLIRQKYGVAFLLFSVWMLFFDSDNLIRQFQRMRQIHSVHTQIDYYQKELKTTEEERKALYENDAYFEKFVRENYLLKRDDEDIFVFSDH